MKKLITILSFLFATLIAQSQINLTVEGVDYTMTTHNGYEIARTSPTNLIFRYNRITTSMEDGLMLTAGDNDYSVSTSTNLDGAQIYGSRFISTNILPSGSLHGMMVGYNENYDIHHNYVSSYDYGITHEGGFPYISMSNALGGIYSNIIKNNNYSIVEKGFDGTRIIGNTFYSNLNIPGSQFIGIKQSDTGGLPIPYPNSKNTKVKNNIFYYAGSIAQFHAIKLGTSGDDTEAEMDTVGFESDYNIYFWENTAGNKPFFEFNGATLTWEQWRALGYDEHSVIMNPNFINTTEFVPTTRIDFGIAITGFETGLSAEDPTWTVGEMPATNTQGSTWQPGARIYETEVIYHADFYVSTTGNDSNPGTYVLPWATWGKAFNSTSVQPGDTVYFMGGVYPMTNTNLIYPYGEGDGYDITRDGTAGNYIKYFAYPGETPILDCDAIEPVGSHNRAIWANDQNYLHFRGLTVRNVWQTSSDVNVYGWGIQGDNLIVENCKVYNTGGRAFFSLGHNITYLNCDSWNNYDDKTIDMGPGGDRPGNDGVGFQNVDFTNEDGSIYYTNCRAWLCGDQGFSAASYGYIEFDGNWSFNNGVLCGEGHGFKMGNIGEDGVTPIGPLKRKYTNNVAAYNRANGWTTKDGGHDAHPMEVYNNIAYKNGYHLPTDACYPMQYGFVIYNTIGTDAQELARVFRNNISYGNEDGEVFIGTTGGIGLYTHSNNTWDSGVTINDADFALIDTTGITAARQLDGSLPNNNCYNSFLRLISTSDLIDSGVDVGLPYIGLAPDIGPFEFEGYIPIDNMEGWVFRGIYIIYDPVNNKYVYKH